MDFSYINGQINKSQQPKLPSKRSSLELRSIEVNIENMVLPLPKQEQKKEILSILYRQLHSKKVKFRDSIDSGYVDKYDSQINLLNADPKNEQLVKMISDDIDIFEKVILKNKLQSKEIKKDMLVVNIKRRELKSSEDKLNLRAELNTKGLSRQEKKELLNKYIKFVKKENKNKVHRFIEIINESVSRNENTIELKKKLATNFIRQNGEKIKFFTKKIEDIKSSIEFLEWQIENEKNEFSIKKIRREINNYMVKIHNTYLRDINSGQKSIAVLSEFIKKLK